MDSIAFVCIPSIGFGEVHGVARFSSDGIELQYQRHDPVLGVRRPELHTAQLPTPTLAEIELVGGVFGLNSRIELQLTDFAPVAEFPRSEDGRLQLRIAWRDRGKAKRAVEQMRAYRADSRYQQLQSEIERLSRQ